MLTGISSRLPQEHEVRELLSRAAREHRRVGLEGISAEHYAGAHWLATFAIYLLTGRGIGC